MSNKGYRKQIDQLTNGSLCTILSTERKLARTAPAMAQPEHLKRCAELVAEMTRRGLRIPNEGNPYPRSRTHG